MVPGKVGERKILLNGFLVTFSMSENSFSFDVLANAELHLLLNLTRDSICEQQLPQCLV